MGVLNLPPYIPMGNRGVLASLRGVNLNVTTDQPIPIPPWCQKFAVLTFIMTNFSATPTLAAGGIYTAAGKTGSILVAATQIYTAFTSAVLYGGLTLTALAATQVITASTLFFSLTTANGSPCAADLYLDALDLT